MRIQTFIFSVLISLLLTFISNAQTISAGASIGGGTISGETPSIGSFSTSLYVETVSPFEDDISIRLAFFYMQDIDKLLPDTRTVYFSFIKGFSLKAILTQELENNFFIEEGLGLITVNDRTLSRTNEWDYGAAVSIGGGLDLRNDNMKGFKIGAGLEFGITFFNTLPKYSSVYLSVQRYF
ncbi:MAG: hypothetical protein IPM56_02060 [Ignavibacteriales bacterium]|nr:MAG: hypothetical protein IPM56_02060 [Ignavibacteriales bacterium]